MSDDVKETRSAVIVYVVLGLIGVVLSLAAFNARSYIEDVAAGVYAAQGLKPSEVKEQLVEINTKLENVEADMGEVRNDLRTLIQKL